MFMSVTTGLIAKFSHNATLNLTFRTVPQTVGVAPMTVYQETGRDEVDTLVATIGRCPSGRHHAERVGGAEKPGETRTER